MGGNERRSDNILAFFADSSPGDANLKRPRMGVFYRCLWWRCGRRWRLRRRREPLVTPHARRLRFLAVVNAPTVEATTRHVLFGAVAVDVVHPYPAKGNGVFDFSHPSFLSKSLFLTYFEREYPNCELWVGPMLPGKPISLQATRAS